MYWLELPRTWIILYRLTVVATPSGCHWSRRSPHLIDSTQLNGSSTRRKSTHIDICLVTNWEHWRKMFFDSQINLTLWTRKKSIKKKRQDLVGSDKSQLVFPAWDGEKKNTGTQKIWSKGKDKYEEGLRRSREG